MPDTEIPWLAAAIDQRLALMQEMLDGDKITPTYSLIMSPLTEPRFGASRAEMEKWERTCDNCGAYCPDPIRFYTGSASREVFGLQVMFTFGACEKCLPPKWRA